MNCANCHAPTDDGEICNWCYEQISDMLYDEGTATIDREPCYEETES